MRRCLNRYGMYASVVLCVTHFSACSAIAELPLNAAPPLLELSGKCGGRLDGTPWSSGEIRDRVFCVYYIDPDEADLNEPLFSALKDEKFTEGKLESVAIINKKATWMPGGVLSLLLKRKQKKYPTTTYVEDRCGKLVRDWTLEDHSSDILLFNRRGEVLFSRDGRLSETEISKMIDLIWKNIGGKPADVSDN